jgi:hypothetical protein
LAFPGKNRGITHSLQYHGFILCQQEGHKQVAGVRNGGSFIPRFPVGRSGDLGAFGSDIDGVQGLAGGHEETVFLDAAEA